MVRCGDPAESPRRRRLIVCSGLMALATAVGLDARDLDARRKRRKHKKKRKQRHDEGGNSGSGGQVCSSGCAYSVCGVAPAACPILPATNIWNRRIDGEPVEARSAQYVASIGAGVGLHPDFGSGLYEGKPFGIPFVRVPRGQPSVRVVFTGAPGESDPGPYPIPADAPVENASCSNGDRHVIVVQEGPCRLYELYDARQQGDGSWQA